MSTRFCMAVGDTYGPGAGNDTAPFDAAYAWDGSTWTATASPGSALSSGTGSGGWLDTVSCGSSAMCLASVSSSPSVSPSGSGGVGYGVLEWNGSSWADTRFPDPQDQIAALDCLRAQWCMAVIDPGQDVAGAGEPMSAVWNGHAWTTTPLGRSFVPGFTAFALSCPTTTFCMTTSDIDGEIMGSAQAPTQQNVSYAWNGTQWTGVAWPSSTVTVQGALACPTERRCLQLASPNNGSAGYGKGDVAFTWSGDGWSGPSAALPGSIAASSMSCASASLCMAVGSDALVTPSTPGGPVPAVADAWNGARWASTTWPSAAQDASIDAVSCDGAGTCGAAGTVASFWQ